MRAGPKTLFIISWTSPLAWISAHQWVTLSGHTSLKQVTKSCGVVERAHMATAPTDLGYVNQNDQMVLRKTARQSMDNLQSVYVLRCLECEHEYGVNGGDTPVCQCPACDGGHTRLAQAA